MAIYHLSTTSLSRSAGRSAVAAAAYRAGVRLVNGRDGVTHDYTRRSGVTHAEIVLPAGVDARWAQDRQLLWDAAEEAERRKDARVAREVVVALPAELRADERLALTRELAAHLVARYGVVVDFAIHAPGADGDQRNFHAHLLATTRVLRPEGLGSKSDFELSDRALRAAGKLVAADQVLALREEWELLANHALARAGHEVTLEARSHAARGIELEPTEHMGVHATQMERQGKTPDRRRIDHEAAARNAELIRQKPEQVLGVITAEKAVFDRRDIARALNRYVEDPQDFQNALAAAMSSPALVELQAERSDPRTGQVTPARYTTSEMICIEKNMAAAAASMHEARRHGVAEHHVARAVALQNAAIQREARDPTAGLSQEQVRAVEHITGPAAIAAVVGFAGAGKSTMLNAGRAAWEAAGYGVCGAALAGQAADNLQETAGIPARTLASWERSWAAGRDLPGRADIFVIDEAGMVSTRQLARVLSVLDKAGAKAVLAGDHEQLQSIGAGAAFRALIEQVGHVTLADVRRQRVDWQRQATVDLATHRTAQALAAYHDRGHVHFAPVHEDARAALVRDYLADLDARPDASRVAMAHARRDVHAINSDLRAALRARGGLAGELPFATRDGSRNFAPGDRLIFLQNNAGMKVKNGTLGSILEVNAGRIVVRLDRGETIAVDTAKYQALDHGYAATIHKKQGATADRAFVLASKSFDRHLTYVSMTRHRAEVNLYAGSDELPALQALTRRLSRSGVKENAVDYARDFGERRGLSISDALGVHSEISLPRTEAPPPAQSHRRPLVPAAEPPAEPLAAYRARRQRELFAAKLATWREKAAAAGVWRRPDVVEKLADAIALADVDGRRSLADAIRRTPERFGEMAGARRLMRGDDDARKAAARNAPALADLDQVERQVTAEVTHEDRARSRRSIEIPAPAPEHVAEWQRGNVSPAAAAAAAELAVAARRRWPGGTEHAADLPVEAAALIKLASDVDRRQRLALTRARERDVGLSY
ncbi:Ti-type conjugative transfer relaxase TraA [Xanthobacter sediminis]|uniref:Ti-type conjugative transfer relaxase TraA n=1 Tax=Xanthobacter sediminis TaxID=3119926 RepID=UPI0037288D25